LATSGVTTFSLTSDQLVNAALRKLSVLGDGQSPSATQLTNGTQALNVMLKTFTTKGMPLWVMAETSITLTATRTYTIGIGQTKNIPAPLKVTQALLADSSNDTNIPMLTRSHYDFNLLSSTDAEGQPNTYWYEPKNQVGVLHIYPTPDTDSIANCTVTLVYQKPFEDMVNGSDTLDFPQYWQEAVIYGLAHRLSPEYSVPLADRKVLAQEAEYFLQEALSFGTEEGSLYLMPDWTTTYGRS
jgi:hypothetical protein